MTYVASRNVVHIQRYNKQVSCTTSACKICRYYTDGCTIYISKCVCVPNCCGAHCDLSRSLSAVITLKTRELNQGIVRGCQLLDVSMSMCHAHTYEHVSCAHIWACVMRSRCMQMEWTEIWDHLSTARLHAERSRQYVVNPKCNWGENKHDDLISMNNILTSFPVEEYL